MRGPGADDRESAPGIRPEVPAQPGRGVLGLEVASPAIPVLIVAVITLVGAALRLAVAHQSLFGDELSTYWIVSEHGISGVVSTVYGDAEITPPLYFLAAWLSTRIDLTPELLRAPSLIAGFAAMPLIYLLGLRTVGRAAALIATAITALSPFMIFYSAEARSYELTVVLVVLSTLSMLVASDRDGVRWWAAYAAFTALAVYAHYIAVFALGAQLLWLLVTHPSARPAALLANLAAAIAFLPWLWGLIADLNSPTTAILNFIDPFDFHTARTAITHWWFGYPISSATTRLHDLPGDGALALLGLAVAISALGLAARWLRERPTYRGVRLEDPIVLVILLALAAPVGEAVASAIGTNVLDAGHLAVSWPAAALCLAALLVAAGPRLCAIATVLTISAFAIGAVKMLEARYQGPDYSGAADLIDQKASPGDVVLDATVLNSGPFTGLDVTLNRRLRVFRAGSPPKQDSETFTLFGNAPPVPQVVHNAAAENPGQIFLVAPRDTVKIDGIPSIPSLAAPAISALPPRYRHLRRYIYPGILPLVVDVFALPTRQGDRLSRNPAGA